MAKTRKDLRGRALQKGEMQRSSDKRYVYTYTDPLGRRKYLYANDLVTLREKEAELAKNQLDGLDIYVAGKATVNFVFDQDFGRAPRLDHSATASVYGAYRQPPDLLSLVGNIHRPFGNGLPHW